MSAAITTPSAEKAQALQRLSKIKDELAQRLSRGTYQTRAQMEWALLPDYMKELLSIMAGMDDERACLDWMAFTATERIALQDAVKALRADLRRIQTIGAGAIQ